MSLIKSVWLLTALVGLLLAPAARAQTTPPVMEQDPIGYLHYLETSADPAAVSVRRQIESGPADLARARAAATQEGIPLEAAALQKPLPPDDQNAAPVYAKLAQLLRAKPLGLPRYAQPLSTGYAYTPEQLAAVQKIYDSRPDVWDLVHQAADRPQCVWARDWKQGPALLTPEYATLREAVRLLNTETYLLAAQGKYSDAVTNQARGFRIAAHAASDPIYISYLVGNACDALTLRGMQDVLTLAGPNAGVDAQVQKAVADDHPNLSLRYALGGEVASFQGVAFQQMRGGIESGGVPALISSIAALIGGSASPPNLGTTTPADIKFALDWLAAMEAQTLNNMRALVVASDLTPLARRQAFAQAAQMRNASSKVFTLLSNILLPPYDKMGESDTRRQAQEAVTLAAADVLGAWTSDGTFPAALPHPLSDPFTGRALGYRREGDDGFVVYSAGPEGTFGAGLAASTPVGQVFFRYPLAPSPVPPDMLK